MDAAMGSSLESDADRPWPEYESGIGDEKDGAVSGAFKDDGAAVSLKWGNKAARTEASICKL